jgi:DNA polymerase elongation subunit (family B)
LKKKAKVNNTDTLRIKQSRLSFYIRFCDCKDASEIPTKGYDNTLVLVSQAIDTIMTWEGLDDKDLIISKLLRQDIQKYRSLFPHVSAAIQSRKYPLKGDTIQYIYTDSKHSNPLCRVIPIENLKSLPSYDREKYKEMILDAAETVLGYFGFDRCVYGNIKKGRRKWRWYSELSWVSVSH